MYSEIEIKELINKSLVGIKYPDSPSELYEPMVYSLSMQGKRIRSTLALMTCNIFTDNLTTSCVMPALGLEIFHGFTLVHDDMMDNACLRRNQETVHKRWNANIAILLGDAMCIEAYKLFCCAETSKIPDILDSFNQAATCVCEGQQFDMNYEGRSVISETEYLRMIELKTAALISVSMKIGAIIGGAKLEDINRAATAGLNLGLAFQIQDDVLDTYSDTHKIGKVVGSDIANNKKTFLLSSAMNLASERTKKELTNLLVANIAPEIKHIKVKAIYDDLGIKDLADSKIKEYFDFANCEVENIAIQPERKKLLKSYINKLFARQY